MKKELKIVTDKDNPNLMKLIRWSKTVIYLDNKQPI